MLETAIVLTVFLTLVFGMIELSISNLHEHIVNQGARQAARIAIVHGTLAPPKLAEWSPSTITTSGSPNFTYSIPGTDTGVVGTAIQPYLTGLNLDDTTVTLQWLDGDAKAGSRVRVRVETAHQPFLTFPFSTGWTLAGESTMQIAH